MSKFIIPFYYTLYSRIRGKSKRIAYIFTFIVPILLYIGINLKGKITLMDCIAVIVGFIGLMSSYEIGYINNDVVTIRKEKNPTLRLSKEETDFAYKNILKIRNIKYFISLISVLIIYYMGFDAIEYLIAVVLIDLVYKIHNNVRDKKTIVSFFFLSLLRYITVPIIFSLAIEKAKAFTYASNGKSLILLILVFSLVIALPRTIEKAGEKKYGITSLSIVKRRTNEFRVIYYIVALIIGAILIPYGYSYLILSLYYLLYRLLIWLAYFKKEGKR